MSDKRLRQRAVLGVQVSPQFVAFLVAALCLTCLVAVAVLGTGDDARALPAVEIRPDSGVYDYTARYTAGATRFVTPAEVSDAVSAACAELALTAHRALQLSGVSRMDIIIRDGEPVFIEANVAPGMTETSLVPLAMEAAGLDLGEAVSALVIEATRAP